VHQVLRDGPHTRDIGGDAGTEAVRDAVLRALKHHVEASNASLAGASA
jgi:3-isopropylmalate dehydrogenase